jgi:hypothetical protein
MRLTRSAPRHAFAAAGMAFALAFAAGLAHQPAIASGSEGGVGAQAGDVAAYNAGKGVYATRYACRGCPLADRNLDAATARELLGNKRGVSLSSDEAAALDTYLKRRFKL